ncbi:MAG: protein translocase subunit SecF [Dehalococcoidales bacterium]|nr:protein translocase subunit SecF [Dehalococcoidales bacterium]
MDIVGKRLWFFSISGVIILIGVVALMLFGLKPGVDFSGGSLTTISFKQPVDRAALESALTGLGYQAKVQPTGEGYFSIRTAPIDAAAKAKLESDLQAKFGPLTEVGFDYIDPAIARETGRIAAIAVVASLVGILLYIWWAFRKMPNPLLFGTSGILALAHDVIVVVGVFAILGKVLGWEIDLMFITGILAVIGYSINNTVIIFDRIRENVRMGVSSDFAVTVNSSVVGTLTRTLNTTITTLIAIWALMIFVGSSIQNFLVILMVGRIVGAYDSICVAPGLLVAWQKRSRRA